MSFTYDTSTNIGKVRLLISDTVEATAHFTDEELQVFLDLNDDSVYLAAAAALEAWVASITDSATAEKIGDYSYSKKNVDNKLALAAKYREVEASTPVFEIASPDLITVPESETEEEE
jgi:hypothetical protein